MMRDDWDVRRRRRYREAATAVTVVWCAATAVGWAGNSMSAVAQPGASQPLCRHTARHHRTNAPGAHRELVPRRPGYLILCRYSGVDSGRRPAGVLVGDQLVLDARRVKRLALKFDRLKRLSGSGRATACPADRGAEIMAFFEYSAEKEDAVTVRTSGCRTASNGYLRRSAALPPGPKLIRQLEAMTR
jgi:hypothetical protein